MYAARWDISDQCRPRSILDPLEDTGYQTDSNLFEKTVRRLSRLVQVFQNSDSSSSEDDNMPDPAPAAPQVPNTTQTATIPLFSGKEGFEVMALINSADRAAVLFGWNDTKTLAAVKTRLTGDALTWLSALIARGKDPTHWKAENQPNDMILSKLLMSRFCPEFSPSMAIQTALSLKQKRDETISCFFDRVVMSISHKNFHLKGEDHYDDIMNQDIKMFLLLGAREELRNRVVGVPGAPDNVDDILAVMRSAETALSNASQSTSFEVHEEKPKQDSTFMVARGRGQRGNRYAPSSSRSCWGCGSPTHWMRECPHPRRGDMPNGRGRGRGYGGGRSWKNKRGGFQGRHVASVAPSKGSVAATSERFQGAPGEWGTPYLEEEPGSTYELVEVSDSGNA